jgi:hypothetical protein
MVLQLQILIEAAYPKVDLKYKWKIPYYYLNEKPFCFLNVTKGYVDVGVWLPKAPEKLAPYLESKGRKMMKSLRYFSQEEIDAEVLYLVLKEVHKTYRQGFKHT